MRLDVQQSAEHVDAVAHAEDGWHVESGNANGGDVDDRGEQAGARQRQGDSPHDAAGAQAVDARRLFQRRVHGFKHLDRQDEGQRGKRQALHEAHAGRRGHIERRERQVERAHQPLVEKADARVGDERPAHGLVDARDQQTEGHDGVDQRLARQGRALGHPGDGQPEQQGHHNGHDGEDERVQDGPVGEGIQEHIPVVQQAVLGARGADDAALEADPDDHRHQHADKGDRRNGQHAYRRRSVESGFGCPKLDALGQLERGLHAALAGGYLAAPCRMSWSSFWVSA